MIRVEVVLRNPKMAITILAQGNSLELNSSEQLVTTVVNTASSYVRAEEDSEQDPLFQRIAIEYLDCLDALVTAKVLTLVLKKKVFGVVGPYLRGERDRVDPRIAALRTDWSARGRELNRQDQAVSCLNSQLAPRDIIE